MRCVTLNDETIVWPDTIGLLRKEGLAPSSGCGAVACVVLLAVAVGLALA